MASAEEISQSEDCFLINLEIDDCPMAELPVFDLLDRSTNTLFDDYQSILRETIIEMLEDTPWLDADSRALLLDAGYGTYHTRVGGVVISLRRAALQRLVLQAMGSRAPSTTPTQISLSIRFLLPDVSLPKPPIATSTPSTMLGTDLSSSRYPSVSAPPSEHASDQSAESEFLDQVSDLPGVSPIQRATDRKSTRLNSSHLDLSRMPSSA